MSGHPHRVPTPVSNPQHHPQRFPTPQRGVKSPSGTPQRIPAPLQENHHHPQRHPTPQISASTHPPGLSTSEHPNTAVEQSCSPVVTTVLDNSTMHATGVISPELAKDGEQGVNIDGIVPLRPTPPCVPTSTKVEQSGVSPSNCENPLDNPSQGGVGSAHEYPSGMQVERSSPAQVTEETLGSEPSIDTIARTISFDDEGISKPQVEKKTSPVTGRVK